MLDCSDVAWQNGPGGVQILQAHLLVPVQRLLSGCLLLLGLCQRGQRVVALLEHAGQLAAGGTGGHGGGPGYAVAADAVDAVQPLDDELQEGVLGLTRDRSRARHRLRVEGGDADLGGGGSLRRGLAVGLHQLSLHRRLLLENSLQLLFGVVIPPAHLQLLCQRCVAVGNRLVPLQRSLSQELGELAELLQQQLVVVALLLVSKLLQTHLVRHPGLLRLECGDSGE
mmetsp:Transcript_15415/g.43115  ORF Transcript_15415/g.43115 Transcript_15415/m.43115 type:complete len:226 (+) Transcript_15415:601-1278(+)